MHYLTDQLKAAYDNVWTTDAPTEAAPTLPESVSPQPVYWAIGTSVIAVAVASYYMTKSLYRRCTIPRRPSLRCAIPKCLSLRRAISKCPSLLCAIPKCLYRCCTKSQTQIPTRPLPQRGQFKTLGKGAFGKVKLCLENNEKVAVKTFHKKVPLKQQIAEIRALQSIQDLKHPNIVSLKSLGWVTDSKGDDHLEVAMEYAGDSLAQIAQPYTEDRFHPWLQKGKNIFKSVTHGTIFKAVKAIISGHTDTLSYLKTNQRQVAIEVFGGIAFLHANGIIHCDIKPQNIMMDSKGNIKIGDCSLATRLGSLQPSISRDSCTPLYTGPEFYDAEVRLPLYKIAGCKLKNHQGRNSPKADVYSGGITLFGVFTGVQFNPYRITTIENSKTGKQDEVLALQSELHGNPEKFAEAIEESLSSGKREVDSSLVNILKETTRYNPADRPGAKAVCQALKQSALSEQTPLDTDTPPTDAEGGDKKKTKTRKRLSLPRFSLSRTNKSKTATDTETTQPDQTKEASTQEVTTNEKSVHYTPAATEHLEDSSEDTNSQETDSYESGSESD